MMKILIVGEYQREFVFGYSCEYPASTSPESVLNLGLALLDYASWSEAAQFAHYDWMAFAYFPIALVHKVLKSRFQA